MGLTNRFSGRRSGKSYVTVLAGLIVVGGLLVGLFLVSGGRAPAVQQPIQFNHQAHVKVTGCVLCHRFYETREVAGRPELVRCMLCHAYPVTDKPEAEKLRALAEKGQPIPWVRLTRLPRHVRFSHQRHVVGGKLECSACHGDIAQTTAPPAGPLISITMQFCLDCHRSQTVQIPPAGLEALKEAQLGQDLLEALRKQGRKRFRSPGELLAALAQGTGSEPKDAEKQLIVEQLHPAQLVTRDCFACHR